jgi:hypothetical protein
LIETFPYQIDAQAIPLGSEAPRLLHPRDRSTRVSA